MSSEETTDDELALGVYQPPQPPLGRLAEELQDYEASGWDSCWFPDHLMGEYPPSIWDPDLTDLAAYQETPHAYFGTPAMLSYAAATTDDIRLAVGVSETLRRHPIVLAQTAQTIHHLSGGRMLLGLGSGARAMTEPFGIDYHRPVSRLEEALRIIRLAWETDPTETFDFEGEFWELEDALFALPPVEADGAPPHPPIYLGAHGPRMRSLTGRYADGWYPSFLSPALYAEGWETVAEAAEDAGRDPGDVTRSLVTAAMLAETREEAAELLDSLLVRIVSLFLPPQSFEACGHEHPLGVGQTSFVPTRVGREEALELAEEVPLEVLKDAYLWGTPEDVVAAVEEFRDAGVEHLVLGNLTPLAAVEQYGDSYDRLEEVRETVQSGEGRQR